MINDGTYLHDPRRSTASTRRGHGGRRHDDQQARSSEAGDGSRLTHARSGRPGIPVRAWSGRSRAALLVAGCARASRSTSTTAGLFFDSIFQPDQLDPRRPVPDRRHLRSSPSSSASSWASSRPSAGCRSVAPLRWLASGLRVVLPRHAAARPARLLLLRARARPTSTAGPTIDDRGHHDRGRRPGRHLRPWPQRGRLHDRDRPGRHPVDRSGPDGGRQVAGHDLRPRRCAGSSCRRRRG